MAYIPWKTRDRLLEELNNTGMQTLYDTIAVSYTHLVEKEEEMELLQGTLIRYKESGQAEVSKDALEL